MVGSIRGFLIFTVWFGFFSNFALCFYFVFSYSLSLVFFFFFFSFYSKQCFIVLKKIGKIGGDDRQVRSRLKHVLTCIDKSIKFEIEDVRVLGSNSSSQPPIYEIRLDSAEVAWSLRTAFSRFTRKKNPVRRPPELDGVEVYNSVTLATRVRISVLRVSVCHTIF